MLQKKLQSQLLQKAIDDYIVNYSFEAGLEESTIKNKRNILNRFFNFLNGNPYTVRAVKEFIFYLSQNNWESANSIVSLIKIFRAFTHFLYKRKYISENFAQDLIKPKVPRKEFDYVTPEIIEQIIVAGTEVGQGDRSRSKQIKIATRLALQFILRTGIRINELLEMKGSDLNIYDDPPTFFVNSKGGNRDLLPLPMDLLKVLIPRVKNQRLFEVTRETCNDVLSRGAKKLNIDAHITNHTLRHIFASNLVKNKVPIQLVSRLMRHSSIEITNSTYTHLDVNDLSLALNSAQSIVREGLDQNQVFDMIEQAIGGTRINRDKRFKTKTVRNENGLYIAISVL